MHPRSKDSIAKLEERDDTAIQAALDRALEGAWGVEGREGFHDDAFAPRSSHQISSRSGIGREERSLGVSHEIIIIRIA
jgi:hypothetical protein